MVCGSCDRELVGRQRVWCSKACKNRWRRVVPSKELTCIACGLTVLVPPSRHYRRSYCSKHCADRHYNSTHRSGRNNPNWKGGRVMSYGRNWKKIKNQIRDRDAVCRKCAKTPEENGRALDVHHIRPYRYTADNHPDNLMALCRSCHMRSEDNGRRGGAKFAGPRQLELRPPTRRDVIRNKSQRLRQWRQAQIGEATRLRNQGLSLRQIGRRLGVSHQTVANWLLT